jgi:hypothetical protein
VRFVIPFLFIDWPADEVRAVLKEIGVFKVLKDFPDAARIQGLTPPDSPEARWK